MGEAQIASWDTPLPSPAAPQRRARRCPRGWRRAPSAPRRCSGLGARAGPGPQRSHEAAAAGTKHLCSRALRWGRGRRQVRGLGTVGAAAPLRPGPGALRTPARPTLPAAAGGWGGGRRVHGPPGARRPREARGAAAPGSRRVCGASWRPGPEPQRGTRPPPADEAAAALPGCRVYCDSGGRPCTPPSAGPGLSPSPSATPRAGAQGDAPRFTAVPAV